MKRTKTVPFDEFRSFLKGLGFAPKRVPKAWVFKHRKEGLLVYRLYGDDQDVDPGDLAYTRLFLDYRGVMEGEVFDAYLEQARTPA